MHKWYVHNEGSPFIKSALSIWASAKWLLTCPTRSRYCSIKWYGGGADLILTKAWWYKYLRWAQWQQPLCQAGTLGALEASSTISCKKQFPILTWTINGIPISTWEKRVPNHPGSFLHPPPTHTHKFRERLNWRTALYKGTSQSHAYISIKIMHKCRPPPCSHLAISYFYWDAVFNMESLWAR